MEEFIRALHEEREELLRVAEEHNTAMQRSMMLTFQRLDNRFAEKANSPGESATFLQGAAGAMNSFDSMMASQPVEPGADPLPECMSPSKSHEDVVEAVEPETYPENTGGPSADPSAGPSCGPSAFATFELASEMPQAAAPLPAQATPAQSKSARPNDTSEIFGLQSIVHRTKRYIDILAGALVLLNSFVMMLELELEGRAVGIQLGLGDGSTTTLEEIEPTFQVLDTIFVYVFLAELLLRIAAERLHFFHDVANWFDAVLVVVGMFDVWLIVPLSSGDAEPQNIMMMRLVRAVKCLRAIRMVRTFRLFRGLNLLVKACQCFLPSLGWSMVLLLVFMSMGSLVMGNLLRDFMMDASESLEDRQWIWNRYGTTYRAMWTLYEVTFAGNWPTNARPVLDKVSHGFVVFFLVYITIIVFAVIRVISAIFLKDTLDAAQNDAEQLVVDRLKKKAQYVQKLEEVFRAIDSSSDGMVTEEKLTQVLSNPKVAAYFQTLDVDVVDSTALFHLLDNGDGEITLDEFIEGILRCKGHARAIDQVAMRSELRQLDAKLSRLSFRLKEAGIIKSSGKAKVNGRMISA
ncbi:unnamed protein product [Effrenium voratum]|uniref:EF-hand domain-containing protein n=2 Tax=Effrenium voratum TaxID=2562239 RepID=A0AA36MP91_9DINO|nr:unnamed protein product [Effrenium voratum]